MKLNIKIVLGAILIVLPLRELITIVIDYSSGKLKFWPLGAEIGVIVLVSVGVLLMRSGIKQNKMNNKL